jgi:hypothetical protein
MGELNFLLVKEKLLTREHQFCQFVNHILFTSRSDELDRLHGQDFLSGVTLMRTTAIEVGRIISEETLLQWSTTQQEHDRNGNRIEWKQSLSISRPAFGWYESGLVIRNPYQVQVIVVAITWHISVEPDSMQTMDLTMTLTGHSLSWKIRHSRAADNHIVWSESTCPSPVWWRYAELL